MLRSPWNLLDALAVFPPLLEHLVAHSIRINFSMGTFDFRWFKILRWAGMPSTAGRCCSQSLLCVSPPVTRMWLCCAGLCA